MTRTRMASEQSWERAISVQATFSAVDIRMIPFIDFLYNVFYMTSGDV
jgi:hypothetical protein